MSYSVGFSKPAEKQLQKLDNNTQRRIQKVVNALMENPRPPGCEKLKAKPSGDLYRIRTGDYRVVYQIKDSKLIILVVTIGHRSDVYRGM